MRRSRPWPAATSTSGETHTRVRKMPKHPQTSPISHPRFTPDPQAPRQPALGGNRVIDICFIKSFVLHPCWASSRNLLAVPTFALIKITADHLRGKFTRNYHNLSCFGRLYNETTPRVYTIFLFFLFKFHNFIIVRVISRITDPQLHNASFHQDIHSGSTTLCTTFKKKRKKKIFSPIVNL